MVRIYDEPDENDFEPEEEREPTLVEEVEDFFEKYGNETIFKQDLGYDCWAHVSVERLYRMFRLRYELEKEGHEFI